MKPAVAAARQAQAAQNLAASVEQINGRLDALDAKLDLLIALLEKQGESTPTPTTPRGGTATKGK